MHTETMANGLTEIDMAAAWRLVQLRIAGGDDRVGVMKTKKVPPKRYREEEIGEERVEPARKRQRFLSVTYLYEITKPTKVM
ncbi:hypothetical protein MA16_Dca008683 [Dendrobium catenatum]|uniref:Uncharacterized protein n=1 Tax=Dendrobium catenatum TaxID=906689 RepID=A0A2I0W4H7_9ASPA|nr:hypothetical protein MA16_Dca008683 [Dendrobium catenatum]